MLLMGMWMSLTKNPMNPISANPIAVAIAIFWNSFLKMSKIYIHSTLGVFMLILINKQINK